MMIYDRTSADVSRAASLIKRGKPFTEEEIDAIERGAVTLNTLNRIEGKQIELAEALNSMGYGVNVSNKTWAEGQFFFAKDLKRLVDNTVAIRMAFGALSDTPTNPRAEYHYREFNLLERVLNDVQENIEITEGFYKICGEAECGG